MKTDRQQGAPPASDVRRRRQPQAAAAAAGAEHQRRTTWPLEIHTLGRFDVRIEGTPIQKARKAPHRLLELLQAVIAFGGEQVPVSRLIDQVWPHSDGDRAVATFEKTLKRLRHYLAAGPVIRLDHGTVTLDPTRCWVDAWAFEQGLLRFERSRRRRTARQWESDVEKALALYRGPFLSGQRLKPWAAAARERLRGSFVRAVAQLGDQWQRQGRLEEAIQCLDRGLQVDSHAEPLYAPLIKLLLTAGRLTEAGAVYHQCVRVFAGELRQPLPVGVKQLCKNVLGASV